MKTIEEVRHDWLLRLIEKHGTVANLNAALGRERTHAAINQLKNKAPNTRTGKVRSMGSDLAREIEGALNLERGTLDHEPRDTPPPPSGAVFYQLDVEAACGDGRQNADYPEIVRAIVLSDTEAREHIGSLNNSGSIRVIVATGDSMVPTIQPRDLLFVDTAVTEFSGDGIYLIRRDHGLSCKRLSMAGRTLLVTSDNPVARDWKWKDKRESDAIIGRVLAALPMTFKQFY